jgi:hypothetical protein
MVTMTAGELFQELVLAKSSGLTIKHIFNKVYPYQTASRVNKRIVQEYPSRRLTQFAKGMFKVMC